MPLSFTKKLLVSLIVLFAISCLNLAHAIPSGGKYPPQFALKYGEWFDSWGFNRNYYAGADGYLPNLAYESIGVDRERAYELGEWFRSNYVDRSVRAEAILAYVQSWTDYGYDSDNVIIEEVPQDEWAWNADEMAHMFDETTFTVAIGDCEDMSFLCSTIYLAAGFDVALVSPPEHVALLIWLPEYDNANYYWDISGDGNEYGWIWVEATGEQNSLGWTPPDFTDGDWEAYLLGFSLFNVDVTPRYPTAKDEVSIRASIVSARGSITQVFLNYSIENVEYALPLVAEDSIFEAVIPNQPDGTTVKGTVSAIDSVGFYREYMFEYVVGTSFEIQFPPYLLEAAVVFLALFLLGILIRRRRR